MASIFVMEYYETYLNLKEKIQNLAQQIECRDRFDPTNTTTIKMKQELNELVQSLKTLLSDLKLYGVTPEDLLLLSLGVNISLFGK